ncbi:MAG: phosphoglucosamine mutase [Candidatus Ranarchaeia archaeon]
MKKTPNLFGSSGIRGVFGSLITPGLGVSVGQAVAAFINGQGQVVVGHDHRTTSPLLYDAVVSGLNAVGVEAVCVGLASTPTTAFLARQLDAKAAIIITASHNPPEYNGFKLWNSDGQGFTKEQQEKIEEYILGKSNHLVTWRKIPKNAYRENGNKDHIQNIVEPILKIKGEKKKKSLKVVVDAGWGTGSLITPYVFEKLGLHVISLHAPPNGRNYTKNCDKFPENITEQQRSAIAEWHHFINMPDLIAIIRNTSADFGIAHDGDADRVLVLDGEGTVISGDKLLAIFTEYILQKKGNRGKPIVTTVSASLLVDEIAERYNSNVIRVRVGDVFVSAQVKASHAAFGGEPTGPYIFPDFHYCPDGPLSAAKLYEILTCRQAKLAELEKRLPTYPMRKADILCPDKHKYTTMKKIAENITTSLSGIKKINKLDGIRCTFEDNSWFLIRPSGTEPLLRLTVEARTEPRVNTIFNKLYKLVKPNTS